MRLVGKVTGSFQDSRCLNMSQVSTRQAIQPEAELDFKSMSCRVPVGMAWPLPSLFRELGAPKSHGSHQWQAAEIEKANLEQARAGWHGTGSSKSQRSQSHVLDRLSTSTTSQQIYL